MLKSCQYRMVKYLFARKRVRGQQNHRINSVEQSYSGFILIYFSLIVKETNHSVYEATLDICLLNQPVLSNENEVT